MIVLQRPLQQRLASASASCAVEATVEGVVVGIVKQGFQGAKSEASAAMRAETKAEARIPSAGGRERGGKLLYFSTSRTIKIFFLEDFCSPMKNERPTILGNIILDIYL